MPKLLYSPASPYSAKVRLCAALAGVAVEPVVVNTVNEPAELVASNPLGKIPVWIGDAGEAIYDSAVIVQHLDRISGGKLQPADPQSRTEAETLEALADGICDALLAQRYEATMRPAEKQHQPWTDAQMRKAVRGLDWLETHVDHFADATHAGAAAVACCLAYHDLRFGTGWRDGRPELAAWLAAYEARTPAFGDVKPRA